MPIGLPVAILMMADTAGAAAPPAKECSPAKPDPNSTSIVICAQKPEGYRINPDVMVAKREVRSGGRPRNPHEQYRDNNCATVGPMGCRFGPTINLMAAAATAAEMAARLGKGQEVGSMFVTDPHPSEYQLYLEAKEKREEKEADVKAAAVKAKAEATAKAAGAGAITGR